MKLLTISLMIFSLQAFASNINGHYSLIKAECPDGKVLNMGGPFIDITMTLNIVNGKMVQTAAATSKSYAPFGLINCQIVNEGEFDYLDEDSYYGYLAQKSCSCTHSTFTKLICSKGMGVQPEGVTDYELNNGVLAIKNLEANGQSSSCKDGQNPVYYYGTRK